MCVVVRALSSRILVGVVVEASTQREGKKEKERGENVRQKERKKEREWKGERYTERKPDRDSVPQYM